MNYVEMGLKIRILREEKRLTQMMLAELTGMTDREVSNIESGKVTPLFSSIYEIAKALNTSIDYLVSEGDDPDKEKYIHDIAVRIKNLSPADIIHISEYIKFYEKQSESLRQIKEVAVCKLLQQCKKSDRTILCRKRYKTQGLDRRGHTKVL